MYIYAKLLGTVNIAFWYSEPKVKFLTFDGRPKVKISTFVFNQHGQQKLNFQLLIYTKS